MELGSCSTSCPIHPSSSPRPRLWLDWEGLLAAESLTYTSCIPLPLSPRAGNRAGAAPHRSRYLSATAWIQCAWQAGPGGSQIIHPGQD
jgi:hypothetical protein